MTEFTKGKCTAEAVYGDHWVVFDFDNERTIADCFSSENKDRLIATVPELYELIKDFCDEVETFVSIYDNFPEEFTSIAERAREVFERIDEVLEDD